MLTISISESLSMAPEAWSEWEAAESAAMYMTGFEETADQQEGYAPWGLMQQSNQFDIWSPQPEESVGQPSWSKLPSFVQAETEATLPWQTQPRKLAIGGESSGPVSSWASPLRVPLPDPLLESSPLIEEPLDLSSASASETLAPWAKASEDFITPPPGLSVERIPTEPADTPAQSAAELPPGISVRNLEESGSKGTRVEWRIEDLYGKLQASMGRPVVSPPFSAAGLPNLRLMVFPDGRDTMKNARSSERRGLYAAMIKKGPLNGALKIKADCLQVNTMLTVNLTVGKLRSGPLVYDFSEQAIHGLDDFGADWLKQVDKASGSLTVGIDILEVRAERR
eukprot:TRINITY_DN78486_c0_g1_i1.p1 TRINITY_DN78486_c0_g1~~TRINITY_DN78486_c0_g1_i1.p1  ORF type:complete len:339 (+),score=78.25 TRINITY_DN78486_c0_g1_i1:78-1094(+)